MTLKVCIGYDHKEAIAYHVLAHSIMRRASRPVSIQPIMLSQLSGVWERPRSPEQSTDFTYARFLTPWLAGDGEIYGRSIFLDSDMLCLDDICKLDDLAFNSPYSDVMVVKHDYTPSSMTKFLKQPQTTYPCKNWSSVMVFNGHRQRVRDLHPAYVNRAAAMDLHQFKWAESVGELPAEWNHLVGERQANPNAKLVHFTLGGPWFKGYEKSEYTPEWLRELDDMLHASDRAFHLLRDWL